MSPARNAQDRQASGLRTRLCAGQTRFDRSDNLTVRSSVPATPARWLTPSRSCSQLSSASSTWMTRTASVLRSVKESLLGQEVERPDLEDQAHHQTHGAEQDQHPGLFHPDLLILTFVSH